MTFDDGYVPPGEDDAPFDGTNVRPFKRPAHNAGPRVPPHDLAAEASLLGAMLLNASAIDAAANLTAADFYKPAHGHIHNACVTLHAKGEPADPVTVADELHRDGLLERIGGPELLVELQAGCPATSNAGRYATIIDDHARLRRLIAVAAEIADLGYSLPDDVSVVEARVLDLVTPRQRNDAASMFTDLAQVADTLEPPDLCERDDKTTRFLYSGRVHTLIGPSEAGKTFLAAHWCRQVINEGHHAIMLDWEDSAVGHKARLLEMGARREDVEGPEALFHYAGRDGQWTSAERVELRAMLALWEPALVVVDAMTPALMVENADDYRGVDIARFYSDVVRECRNAGAAVLIIDHVNKHDKTQTGGHYKKGGIDGVQYMLENAVPMGRGKRGMSVLTVEKDRHGFLRGLTVGPSDQIGLLTVDSIGDDGTEVGVGVPVGAVGKVGADGAFRYPDKMEALSLVIEAAGPDGAVRTSVGAAVKGKATSKQRALMNLLTEGWCREIPGSGRVVSVTAFRVLSDTDS